MSDFQQHKNNSEKTKTLSKRVHTCGVNQVGKKLPFSSDRKLDILIFFEKEEHSVETLVLLQQLR